MTYAQSEACLDALRWQNPTMFLMAISHLIDVGIRHLTPEAIEETCNEIMQQDDAGYIMTNDFQCELVRMAGKIAKIDHIHLLVYISRNTFYDVGDGKLSYDRMDELLRYCVDYITSSTYREPYEELCENCYFCDDDFEALGIENMIPGREENEDDD